MTTLELLVYFGPVVGSVLGVALAKMGLVTRIGPRVNSVGTRHIGYCLTEAGRAAAEGLR